ncbi:MAG: Maf family protein [Treponema sp.]|jgi:septum formation protein|nr:Maf family protein [Treponema sp.]
METIILASASPRRQEYFKMMGLPFVAIPAEIDESSFTQKNPEKLTAELAVKKVEKALELAAQPPEWICGADTVIALDDEILGKPKNRNEAAEMLRKLAGREHSVITSLALYNGKVRKIDCRTSVCAVFFSSLNDEEIEWYLDTNEWQGAAGAYRIQGLASCFISGINGSPDTVAGLPLNVFYAMLIDNGYLYRP